MMPPPLIIAAATLLGWPLLKLAATLVSRPMWERVRALSAELELDERYGDAELPLIDRVVKEAKGEPLQILMPIFVLAGGIAFAFAHPFNSSAKYDEDESVEDVRRKISELEFQLCNSDSQFRPFAHALGIEFTRLPPHSSLLWTDKRFQRLDNLSYRLSLLRYPVASLLTGLAAMAVSPLIFLAKGLRASAWIVVQRLVRSSAYSSRAFARSVGVIS